ncbi:hypothetical protein TWF696_004624 [Orbilia brochopaga]|uniref:Uncharacterized protein n=1 Tax=Orbilia brochopaga TaxID=3140254 RepID=A0AAV9V929_9PEZI
MSGRPSARQQDTQQAIADLLVPTESGAPSKGPSVHSAPTPNKQERTLALTAPSAPSLPEGKIVGPFEEMDISKSPQPDYSPPARWTMTEDGYIDISEVPSSPAEILASSTPEGAAMNPSRVSTSSESAQFTSKSDNEKKGRSDLSPSERVAKPSKPHLPTAGLEKLSSNGTEITESASTGPMVDNKPGFAIYEDEPEQPGEEEQTLEKLKKMLIDAKPTTTAAHDIHPPHNAPSMHFPPYTNTTNRPVRFFSAPRRLQKKEREDMFTNPQGGKTSIYTKPSSEGMGVWDSNQARLQMQPGAPGGNKGKQVSIPPGFGPLNATTTGPPKQENVHPSLRASASHPSLTYGSGQQGSNVMQVDPAGLVPYLGWQRHVRKAITEKLIKHEQRELDAARTAKLQEKSEPVDLGTWPKPAPMRLGTDNASKGEPKQPVFPKFPAALCPVPAIQRQWVPDGYLVEHISHIPAFLQRYQPRIVYAMFECSFASSDNINDVKVPLRIGRLSLFIPIQMKDGSVITVALAPYELFSSEWKGTGSNAPRRDRSVLGKEAFEIAVNGSLKADCTCDRNIAAPTGRIIGTTFGLVSNSCILKIEDWFLASQKFKTQIRPVPVLDRPVPKDAKVVRYAETKAYDEHSWELERRREKNTKLSVAGLGGIPDNQPRSSRQPVPAPPGVIRPPKHISVATLGGDPEPRKEPVRAPWHF